VVVFAPKAHRSGWPARARRNRACCQALTALLR
jgi:hypothetical protein